MKYKYIEIRCFQHDDEIVKRLDVTNQSERNIEKIDNGMNLNLNHNEYFTVTIESDEPLPLIN